MTLVSAEEDGPSHRGTTRTGTSQSEPGGMNSAPALPDHQSTPADQAGARSALTSRIEALDLVRLLAIVGMMATHLLVPLSMTPEAAGPESAAARIDRKSTRLNSSHVAISYAVFCFKTKRISRS